MFALPIIRMDGTNVDKKEKDTTFQSNVVPITSSYRIEQWT